MWSYFPTRLRTHWDALSENRNAYAANAGTSTHTEPGKETLPASCQEVQESFSIRKVTLGQACFGSCCFFTAATGEPHGSSLSTVCSHQPLHQPVTPWSHQDLEIPWPVVVYLQQIHFCS